MKITIDKKEEDGEEFYFAILKADDHIVMEDAVNPLEALLKVLEAYKMVSSPD